MNYSKMKLFKKAATLKNSYSKGVWRSCFSENKAIPKKLLNMQEGFHRLKMKNSKLK